MARLDGAFVELFRRPLLIALAAGRQRAPRCQQPAAAIPVPGRLCVLTILMIAVVHDDNPAAAASPELLMQPPGALLTRFQRSAAS
jgi:hypothetical protein